MSVGPLSSNMFFIHGSVYCIVTDQEGNYKKVVTNHNAILTMGRQVLLHVIGSGVMPGEGSGLGRFLGLGYTAGATIATADQLLTTEWTGHIRGTVDVTTRVSMLFQQGGGSVASQEITMEGTCQFYQSISVNELGLFWGSEATADSLSMLAKVALSAADFLVLASTDKLTVRWVFSLNTCQST